MNGYTRTGTRVPHQHRACAVRVSCRACPCPWTMRHHPHPQRTTYSSNGSTLEPKGGGKEDESSRVEECRDWMTDCWRLWRYDAQLVRDNYQSHFIRRLLQALIDALLHFLFYYCHHRPSGEYNNNIECIVSRNATKAFLHHFQSLESSAASAYHQWSTCVHQITLKQQQHQYCDASFNFNYRHELTLVF